MECFLFVFVPGNWSTFDCHDKISLISLISLILWHNKCILQHWNSYYNWLVVLMLMIKPVQKGGQNKTHCCIYIQYSLPFWRLFQVFLRHFRSNVRVILAVTLWRHSTNLVQPTPPRGSVIVRVIHNLNRLIWKKMLTRIAGTYKFIKLVSLLKLLLLIKQIPFCFSASLFTPSHCGSSLLSLEFFISKLFSNESPRILVNHVTPLSLNHK